MPENKQHFFFSMKLQAAAFLCCAYKVPIPPTPSPDHKPLWTWGFLKLPTACAVSFACLALQDLDSTPLHPLGWEAPVYSSHADCLCGKVKQKRTGVKEIEAALQQGTLSCKFLSLAFTCSLTDWEISEGLSLKLCSLGNCHTCLCHLWLCSI